MYVFSAFEKNVMVWWRLWIGEGCFCFIIRLWALLSFNIKLVIYEIRKIIWRTLQDRSEKGVFVNMMNSFLSKQYINPSLTIYINSHTTLIEQIKYFLWIRN